MPSPGIKEVRYRHESIVDLMIENPQMKQRELAARIGVTESWLSTIVHSDAFKEYYAARREEHICAITEYTVERDDRSLIDQTNEVAKLALQRIEDKLSAPTAANIELNALTNTAAKTLNALGFGSAPGGDRGRGGDVNILVGSVDPEVLAKARQRMLNARAESATPVNEVIDAESEVSSA